MDLVERLTVFTVLTVLTVLWVSPVLDLANVLIVALASLETHTTTTWVGKLTCIAVPVEKVRPANPVYKVLPESKANPDLPRLAL
jgi:hypothetical protein